MFPYLSELSLIARLLRRLDKYDLLPRISSNLTQGSNTDSDYAAFNKRLP